MKSNSFQRENIFQFCVWYQYNWQKLSTALKFSHFHFFPSTIPSKKNIGVRKEDVNSFELVVLEKNKILLKTKPKNTLRFILNFISYITSMGG
jgi:hypothetical protein